MLELTLGAGVIGLLAVIVWARGVIQARHFNDRHYADHFPSE